MNIRKIFYSLPGFVEFNTGTQIITFIYILKFFLTQMLMLQNRKKCFFSIHVEEVVLEPSTYVVIRYIIILQDQ